VSWYQKGKTNLDLLSEERQRVAVASAGPYVSLQLTQTDNHTSILALFLLPSQHRQSTEGKLMRN